MHSFRDAEEDWHGPEEINREFAAIVAGLPDYSVKDLVEQWTIEDLFEQSAARSLKRRQESRLSRKVKRLAVGAATGVCVLKLAFGSQLKPPG
ncbi:hypothetical protein HYW36_00765 [Candidatus Saccharibacteria bacterium]|nr:hypothetical protein [Candidatus Saccharibacteria bacterium]